MTATTADDPRTNLIGAGHFNPLTAANDDLDSPAPILDSSAPITGS
jgi:hypothetical protein